ncbi:cation diffusion facilitator family transporter [Candidatus Liberibacter americanus]|uniref:Cobalt-zinc-cadmium resistance protein n=1 Tax=Candidatus Liberibacter americanus str. Sao Paulo TaxID=1261131 RepID=U6B483_9HYPH|nr:cation diffusion facilitator family transporter [Candidatus Liberibacter americanus]AHA27705.1 Cobalt-zinc-cadmium resistance protein [Candidatus Liberibacter americanus str. Sao Paulo]EMS36412.1 cation efflux protein [Candidatus Liberibacter americanus PW_SP]
MKLNNNRAMLRIALWAIPISIIITLFKISAWYLTGFISLLSDGLESIINIVIAIISYFTILYASLPADKNHPFGHQKAEYIAAVVEGILMVNISFLVLYESWQIPVKIHNNISIIGFSISVLANIINLFWGRFMIKYGETNHSAALEANGRHILSDVMMSLGILSGLIISVITNYNSIDVIIATVMSLNIFYQGAKVISSAIKGLMDAAVKSEHLEKIKKIISLNAYGSREIHDLKVRQSGSTFFINFHLVVDSNMTVLKAHRICNSIEKSIEEAMPHSLVTIHVEPENEFSHGINIKL